MTPELSRVIAAERIGPGGAEQSVEATPDECRAVAERLDIPAVAKLSAAFHLRRAPEGDGRIEAEGTISARLSRVCVVTLEPFEADVSLDMRVVFVPSGSEREDVDPDAADEIPYASGAIDLGEAAVEELALSLDPFPRMPGAALPDLEEAAPAHPFAVLAKRRP